MWPFDRLRPQSSPQSGPTPPALRAILRDGGVVDGFLISDADIAGKHLEFRMGTVTLGRALLGPARGSSSFPFKTKLTLDARAAVDIFLMPEGLLIGGALAIHRSSLTSAAVPLKPGEIPIDIVKPLRASPGGEVALFVTHSRTGAIKPSVLPYLRSVQAAGVAIQLVVATDRPVALPAELLELVDGAAVRRNYGFDFAAWAHVLTLVPELYGASILYLLNDSVIAGDGDVLTRLFTKVRAEPADLVGLTASFEHRWHLQSYFLAIRARLLASVPFQEFIDSIRVLDDKDAVVGSYEVRLTEHVENVGFTARALFDVGTAGNPTILGWRALLDAGFPFVKVGLLAGRQAEGVPDDWPTALREAQFDLELVRRTLEALEAPELPRDGAMLLDRPPIPLQSDLPLRVTFVGPWNHAGAQGADARRLVAALRRLPHMLNLRSPSSVYGRTVSPNSEIRSFAGRADVVIADLPPHGLSDWDSIDARYRIWIQRVPISEAPISGHAIDRVWAIVSTFQARPDLIDPRIMAPSTPIEQVAEWLENAFADLLEGTGAAPTPIASDLLAGLPPDTMLTPKDFQWLVLDSDGTLRPDSQLSEDVDWIGIVCQGSLLSPTFHLDMGTQSLSLPDVDIFYADDLAMQAGLAIDQLRLKPDFDRTLLRSQDYIGVPLIVRSRAFFALGGLRAEAGTAMLCDFLLRADASNYSIARIPKVLLASPGERFSPKVEDHARVLATNFVAPDVDAGPVTVLIPTRRAPLPDGAGTYIERLLDAIAGVDWPLDHLTVIVGDDIAGRPDWADRDWPFQLRWVATPRPAGAPFNYAAKMNYLIRIAECEQLIFLNDDVLPLGSGWIAALQAYATDPAVGGVGAHLLFPDGRLQHAGMAPQGHAVSHIWFGRADRIGTYQNWGAVAREWSMVTGAVFATRATLLTEIGGFDEQFSLEFNDTDLCLRLRSLGYRIVCTPDALFEHAEKASRGTAPPPGEEVARFLLRWRDWLSNDPHWHPRLRRDRLEMQPRIDPDAWYL